MADSLKPLRSCPFCGSAAAEVNGHRLWHVACPDCGACCSQHKRGAEAIAAWNRRPLRDKLAKLVEQFQERHRSHMEAATRSPPSRPSLIGMATGYERAADELANLLDTPEGT